MLDAEFKKQRAQTARELAAIAIDPFIKKRLIDLNIPTSQYRRTHVSAPRPSE